MNKKQFNYKMILIFVFVVAIFTLHGGLVIYWTWPISEFSISKAGGYGDSFGIITAFFSGLAFAGVIYTISLQRDELNLTRKELIKTANAAEEQVQHFSQQKKREDLYRLLTKLYERIDNQYTNAKTNSSLTLMWFTLNYNDSKQNTNINKFYEELKDPTTNTYKIIKNIEENLIVFMRTLKAYEMESGERENSSPLTEHYRLEFSKLIRMLHGKSAIKRTLYDYYVDIHESEILE